MSWVKVDRDEFIKKIREASGTIVSSTDHADIYLKQSRVVKIFEELNYPILPEDKFIEEWREPYEVKYPSGESRALLAINGNLINLGKLIELLITKEVK